MTSKLKNIRANKHLLYILKNAKPKLRNAILKNADNSLIKTLYEIIYNTIYMNHPIDKKCKKVLTKYKTNLRCLACPKRSLPSKRELLIQKGGFLPTLISTILGGIIGKILENVNQ